MADLIKGGISRSGSAAAQALDTARLHNGPRETQAADKLPHSC